MCVRLRLLAGRDPSDAALTALVGELATHSDAFRAWWGGHTVHTHTSGTKRINHPLVGELTLGYETLALPSTPASALGPTSPNPAPLSADGLDMLRSWIATPSTSPSTSALSGVEAPNP